MIRKKVVISVMSLCLITASANAGLFSGYNGGISGDLFHGSDDKYEIVNGGACFEWGTTATGFDKNNRFTFTGFGFSNVMENTAFAIGEVHYQNVNTLNSSGINGVKLAIKKMLTDPVIENPIFDCNFANTNIPDIKGISVDDGDISTFASTPSLEIFTCSGSNMLLNLFGLSSDGGTTICTDSSSPEGSNQSAQLPASNVTAESANVPEPGILSLFVLGFSSLASFALLRRKN